MPNLISYKDVNKFLPSKYQLNVEDEAGPQYRAFWDGDVFSWNYETESEYEEKEKEISEFQINRKYYTIYTWCDVSGFDYWKDQHNYVQITIAFKEGVFTENVVKTLIEDIHSAICFGESIENVRVEVLHKEIN